jgi:hypothetical protein
LTLTIGNFLKKWSTFNGYSSIFGCVKLDESVTFLPLESSIAVRKKLWNKGAV